MNYMEYFNETTGNFKNPTKVILKRNNTVEIIPASELAKYGFDYEQQFKANAIWYAMMNEETFRRVGSSKIYGIKDDVLSFKQFFHYKDITNKKIFMLNPFKMGVLVSLSALFALAFADSMAQSGSTGFGFFYLDSEWFKQRNNCELLVFIYDNLSLQDRNRIANQYKEYLAHKK